nr:decaprenyl-phosphate phosphoribosyltransferase [Rhizohabitans arisaemae]
MRRSAASATPAGPGRYRGVLRACRPRQWLKNVLVFAAPAAAGVLTTPAGIGLSLIAFVSFCFAASGTYLLNDAADVEADRLHPRKRFRPIAAGVVPVRLARVLGVAFILIAPAVAALSGGWRFPLVVVGYLVLTSAYTLRLKHLAILDLVAVAGCHVIRAYAGAVVVDVPVTSWFLVVISFGSLQLVIGKREAELRGHGTSGTRATLVVYSLSYLTNLRVMVSAATLVTYCLWALDEVNPFRALSIVPFILLMLRLNLFVDRGVGEEPEELVLRDRQLQIFTGLLIALIAVGVYAR